MPQWRSPHHRASAVPSAQTGNPAGCAAVRRRVLDTAPDPGRQTPGVIIAVGHADPARAAGGRCRRDRFPVRGRNSIHRPSSRLAGLSEQQRDQAHAASAISASGILVLGASAARQQPSIRAISPSSRPPGWSTFWPCRAASARQLQRRSARPVPRGAERHRNGQRSHSAGQLDVRWRSPPRPPAAVASGIGQHGVSVTVAQADLPPKGGAVGAWLEDLRPGLFRQHRADREAAPQPFGAGENVRGDVVMLVGVKMAGTPGAGLHLIEYKSGMMARGYAAPAGTPGPPGSPRLRR